MNILLIEDDPGLASGLQNALQHAGYAVNCVNNGRAALSISSSQPSDLIILDLGLPDMDGLVVLKKLRNEHKHIPVLILTARDTVEDKVGGLDSGADDYLAKPFELPELLARLRVLERRSTANTSNTLTVGNVSLDTTSHIAYLDNQEVDMARREYMLLKALMENSGRILTRESLENKLYSWGEEVSSNALEVHIHHLRKKLGTQFIKTVRGVGYTVRHN
ncbi:response regulator [Aurantivibrio plasticivorans]